MTTARQTDLDITTHTPIAHAIRVDPTTFPTGDYEVIYTCSARCCLDELNRLGVAPNQYLYTGSGRWSRYTWGTVTDPDLPDGRPCRSCGSPIPQHAASVVETGVPRRTTRACAAAPEGTRTSLISEGLSEFVFDGHAQIA